MTLNVAKRSCIRFSNKRLNIHTEFYLDTEQIALVTDVKYLGVFFSSSLTWNSHVEIVTRKSGRVLNLIKINFRNAHRDVKELIDMSNVCCSDIES